MIVTLGGGEGSIKTVLMTAWLIPATLSIRVKQMVRLTCMLILQLDTQRFATTCFVLCRHQGLMLSFSKYYDYVASKQPARDDVLYQSNRLLHAFAAA